MKKFVIVTALALAAGAAVSPASAVSFDFPQPAGNILMLGATVRESLTTVDTNNTTYRTDNGLQWFSYGVPDGDGAMGFANPLATLDLESCDTNSANLDVLCWHGMNESGVDYITQGYRWDQVQDIYEDDGFFRVMFTSDDPTYYPSGAQYDVPIDDLKGWTACWADDWGTQWGEHDVAYDDLFAACDGDYLMMAVAEDVTEGDSPFTIAGEDNLAETGLDAAPIVAVGLLAIAGGAIAIRRRRTN
jgi:hypothetical protein